MIQMDRFIKRLRLACSGLQASDLRGIGSDPERHESERVVTRLLDFLLELYAACQAGVGWCLALDREVPRVLLDVSGSNWSRHLYVDMDREVYSRDSYDRTDKVSRMDRPPEIIRNCHTSDVACFYRVDMFHQHTGWLVRCRSSHELGSQRSRQLSAYSVPCRLGSKQGSSGCHNSSSLWHQ